MEIFKAQEALTNMGLPFNSELTLTALQAFRARYIFEASTGYQYFLKNGLTKEDYTRFQGLERVNDDTIIPHLHIDGADLGDPGYYFMKVDVMDEMQAIRAACFGKLTKCCQSLSGEAGEPCVIHGLTSPNGGFYVLCKGDVKKPLVTDEVIAQSWAWRSQENALVFDSIESGNPSININMVKSFYNRAAKILAEDHNVPRILCGSNRGFGIAKPINLETFKDDPGYSDARDQLTLIDKNCPWLSFINSPDKQNIWLNKILSSNIKLNESKELCEFLNWNQLNKLNLLKHTQNKKNIPNYRINELNKLNELFEYYFNSGLGDNLKNAIKNKCIPTQIINGYRQTPLMLAIQDNNILIFNALLAQKADTNVVDVDGNTPLIFASQSKNQSNQYMVESLIASGASINTSKINKNTPLMNAIEFGDRAIAALLIQYGAKTENINTDGMTALLYAAKIGYTEVVNLLIERGANTNAVDKKGMTALMYAASSGSTEAVKTLIEHNAKIDPVDKDGMTALMHAANRGQTKVVILLIERGANTNIVDKKEWTALRHATENIHTETVNKLLEKDANPNFTNKKGTSILIYSLIRHNKQLRLAFVNKKKLNPGFMDVIIALLKKGANPNAPSKNNTTPLMYVANIDDTEACKTLLEYKANPRAVNNEGMTALLYAAQKGASETIKILIKNGINPNDVSNNKKTALMFAAEHGMIDVVKILLEAGADVTCMDKQGMTALMYSESSDWRQLYFPINDNYNSQLMSQLINAS